MKDGHMTTDLLKTNYADGVLRDSVWISFTMATMNSFDICAVDIQNFYI